MSTILVAFSQLLILGWKMAASVQNTNILGNGNLSVLWHSMTTLVNFMRHLTSIKILCQAYMKHEHCSQQYSVRHVFIPINCYRQEGGLQNLNCILRNFFALILLILCFKNYPVTCYFQISHISIQDSSSLQNV